MKPAEGEPHAHARIFAGLALVAFATLMYEVLLTRIFSVTMWHHFAFMSISVAMFGLSAGAIIVQAFPSYFATSMTLQRMAESAFFFAVTIVLSFLTHLSVPFAPRLNLVFFYSVALTYAALALPFIFSGICICLALTRFVRSINRLYAVDLTGAAAGCFVVILLLNIVDGPSAVLLVAAVAASAAAVMGHPIQSWVKKASLIVVTLLVIAAAANAVLARKQHPALFITWAKGTAEKRPLYERWNPTARVQVTGDEAVPHIPYRFGMGSKYPNTTPMRDLDLTVDATSLTILTAFHGSFDDVQHLKYLVMNVAQYLYTNGDVLVLGTGGDREILSSLLFGQRSVVGVEINRGVLDAVHGRFGEFTGHLDRDPRVRFVNDDARSFVRQTPQRFDLIQITSIGGVFVLLEQPLYTAEAWISYLDHLKPGGVLSVSRSCGPKAEAEMYRATSLARAVLTRRGVADPRAHIVVVRSDPAAIARSDSFATLLVARDPFSGEQLDKLESASQLAGFEIVLSPRASLDPVFGRLASSDVTPQLLDATSLDLRPTTDDHPYFFNVQRFRDLANRQVWRNPSRTYNLEALSSLVALMLVVVVLTAIGILWPLRWLGSDAHAAAIPMAGVYFCSIGLAYVFIEMALMQMLTMFLGHPTYSIGVVLSTLLIFSGIGSSIAVGRGTGRVRLMLLIVVLIAFASLASPILRACGAMPTSARIVASMLLIAPLGLLMGMPLPLGMRLASEKMSALPWLWGLNGAASVCGSVAAMILALMFGISFVV